MHGDSSSSAENASARTVLPIGALLSLAMTGFLAIMTETIPAGLLPQISAGLGVSSAATGQLVTLYAVGSLIAAVPLVKATSGWHRRPVLLLAVAGLFAFNTVTALSHAFLLTLGARFVAGVAAGLAWGLIAGYARRMVVARLQGRALAIAMIGAPIALSVGVPAGTLIGRVVGWRATFLILSALTLILIVCILCNVPDFPGQSAERPLSVSAIITSPGERSIMFVVFAWMLAHNALYTFIVPLLALADLAGNAETVLLVFGACAMLGIWIAERLVDRWLRNAVLVSLALFALGAFALFSDGRFPVTVIVAVAAWGLTFGGASTLLNTASADGAGANADIALAMVTTIWNLAIAGGAGIGAVLLSNFGARSLPCAALIAILSALMVARRARFSGFPAGARFEGSRR